MSTALTERSILNAHPVRLLGVMGEHPIEDARGELGSILEAGSAEAESSAVLPIHASDHLMAACRSWQTGGSDTCAWSGLFAKHPFGVSSGSGKDLPYQRLAAELLDGGGESLQRVDGSFALVAVRPGDQKGVLARDRFGIRKLFYTVRDGRLYFADDVRTLLSLGGAYRVRTQGLLEWMRYGSPLVPDTLFENISSVPPGSSVHFSWRDQKVTIHRHADPTDAVSAERAEELLGMSPARQYELLEQCVSQTIRAHCAGRKRVSILLSGGVDSSLTTAIAREYAEVDAITVDLRGEDAETEIQYASKVARDLGASLRVCAFDAEVFRRTVCEVVYGLGTPVIIENAIALHHAAASGALPPEQLILDGEGADALFAGSEPLFRTSEIAFLLSGLLHVSDDRVRGWINRLRRYLVKFGITTSTTMDDEGLDVQLGARAMDCLVRRQRLLDAHAHIKSQSEREIAALMLQKFYQYLVPPMARLDTMAWRARSDVLLPFMGADIQSLCLNLPMRSKIRLSPIRPRIRTKWLLKRLAASRIDSRTIYRPKVGFGIPGAEWIGAFPQAWIEDSWVCEHFGIATQSLVERLERDLRSHDRLSLFTMEIWGRLFDRRQPLDVVQNQWLEV